MKPHLWIIYDHTSTSECLSTLDTILDRYPDQNIIHEVSPATLLQAALERVPILSEFRQRLNNNQTIVANFKGYDVPYRAAGRFYYASLTDLVTMMATAPNEAVQEAIQEANTDQKRVVFDLITCLDDDWNVKRAQELADLGASLVRCHTESSEQTGKPPLLEKVCQHLKNSSIQVVAMGCTPNDVKDLKPYVEQNQIFAIAVGNAITRSKDPNVAIAQFLTEINELVSDATVSDTPQLPCDPTWAVIDELIRQI